MAYHHFENGFDEKLDYQTLEEAEKAAQGYVDGTMESDGFAYDGAAIYDQQARKHLRIYGNYPDERAHAESKVRIIFYSKNKRGDILLKTSPLSYLIIN